MQRHATGNYDIITAVQLRAANGRDARWHCEHGQHADVAT
jgi:hypothetical protein